MGHAGHLTADSDGSLEVSSCLMSSNACGYGSSNLASHGDDKVIKRGIVYCRGRATMTGSPSAAVFHGVPGIQKRNGRHT